MPVRRKKCSFFRVQTLLCRLKRVGFAGKRARKTGHVRLVAARPKKCFAVAVDSVVGLLNFVDEVLLLARAAQSKAYIEQDGAGVLLTRSGRKVEAKCDAFLLLPPLIPDIPRVQNL